MGVLGGIPKAMPSFLHLAPSTPRLLLFHSKTLKTLRPPAPAAAAAATASTTSSHSKPPSSSLYPRPSLREMSAQRASDRALVYSFLRGLGIHPDELDGLELPVTLEVMRERVDFLHSLGLSVADINAYPLVLGCSVRKNMIPVLDFLGSLGVRQSSLPTLLRRYPHVLHSSVAVDLAPVVSYLRGLDIKPSDIPRVIERYPELLGFKLEGTISTSVAYLVAIGVARRQIGRILALHPEILGMRVGRVIKPLVEYLEYLGLPRPTVSRIIEEKPFILGFDLQDRVRPNVDALVEFQVRREAIASVVMRYPEVLGIEELSVKLNQQRNLLRSTIFLEEDGDFGKVVERMPKVVNLGHSAVIKHVEFLNKCGFSLRQVNKMVVDCPQLLALNLDVMRRNLDYFQKEMERELEDLVEFPAFFTYGLDSTIKPRHEAVSIKGIDCSLSWLLNCSDEKFAERMCYDSIGMEEMPPSPSFGQKSAIKTEDEEDEESDVFSDFDSDEKEVDYDDEDTDHEDDFF